MKDLQRLPDSELEIMMVIWNAESPVNSDFLMQRLNKNWAKPTLLKLLTRLCERGFLLCYKEGRLNIYKPLIKREDYLRKESKSFLKKMHYNSITSLVTSLYDGSSISKEDLKELKKYIEEVE